MGSWGKSTLGLMHGSLRSISQPRKLPPLLARGSAPHSLSSWSWVGWWLPRGAAGSNPSRQRAVLCRRGSCEPSATHTHAARDGQVTTCPHRCGLGPLVDGRCERPQPGVCVGRPDSNAHSSRGKGQRGLGTVVQASEDPHRAQASASRHPEQLRRGASGPRLSPPHPPAGATPPKLQGQHSDSGTSPPLSPRPEPRRVPESLRKLDGNSVHSFLLSFPLPSPLSL